MLFGCSGYEDEVTRTLQKSIEKKADEAQEIQKQIINLIETRLNALKNKIIDSTLESSMETENILTLSGTKLLEEFSVIKQQPEKLRNHIQLLELVKQRIEAALLHVSTIIKIRKCHEDLSVAFKQNDYEESTKQIIWFRSLMLNTPAVEEAERTLVQTIRNFERQLIKVVRANFRESIIQKNKEIVLRFAPLFYQLSLHKEGVLNYINFLRESISNECASNYRVLTNLSTIADLEQKPETYADVLQKLFHLATKLIKEHEEQAFKYHFDPDAHVTFLRGIESEVDIQSMRILDKFEADFSKYLNYSTETLPPQELKECDVILNALSLISFRYQQFTHFLHATGEGVMTSFNKTSSQMTSESTNKTYSSTHGLAALSPMTRKIQELMSLFVSLEHAYAVQSLRIAANHAEISLDLKRSSSTFPDDVFFIVKKCIMRTIDSLDSFALCALLNLLSVVLVTDIRGSLERSAEEAKQFYSKWLLSQFSQIAQNSVLTDNNSVPNFNFALSVIISQQTEDNLERNITDISGLISHAFLGVSQHSTTLKKTVCRASLSWIHILNDFSKFCSYFGTLITTIDEEYTIRQRLLEDSKNISSFQKIHTENKNIKESTRQIIFQQSLLGLENAKNDFKLSLNRLIKESIKNLYYGILAPSFQQFEALNLVLTQPIYIEYQVNDPYMQKFLFKLTIIFRHLQNSLCDEVLSEFLQSLTQHIANKFEKLIFSKQLNLLGAFQLETDIRHLVQTCGELSTLYLKKQLSRLVEMTELLTVSSLEDLQQLIDPLAIEKPWNLSTKEMKKLMQNRVDFGEEVQHFFDDSAFIAGF